MARIGVQVMTWGTDSYSPEDPEFDGMSQFAQTMLWGGNVGHAAFMLTLPNTEENRKLVKDNLQGTGIPVHERTYETKQVEIDPTTNKPIPTDKVAYREDVIEVYFSYWPSVGQKGFSFNEYHEDMTSEREGVSVNYSPEWQAYLQPEQRIQRGLANQVLGGGSSITLPTNRMTHMTSHSKLESDVLLADQQIAFINNEHSVVSLAISKLSEKKKKLKEGDSVTLSAAEKALVGKYLPEQNVDGKFNAEKIKGIKSQIKKIRDNFNSAKTYSYVNYVEALVALNGDIQSARHDVVMSDAESKVYVKAQDIRKLYYTLNSLDPTDPKNIEKINEIIMGKGKPGDTNYVPPHPAYQISGDEKATIALFKDGVKDAKQFNQLKSAIERELDPSQNAFFGLNKDVVRKGDLNRVYQSLESVERLKALKSKVDHYAEMKTNGTPAEIEQAKNDLFELMNDLKNSPKLTPKGDSAQNICTRITPTADSPWRENDLEFLQEYLNEHLDPNNKNAAEIRAIVVTLSEQGNEVLSTLTEKKADRLFQAAITNGYPPSNVIHLPLEDKSSNKLGLDPEAMLKEMAILAKDERKFNLVTNNCSVSSSRILAKGAGERGVIFEQRAFSQSVANPQMVYNNAAQYSGSLQNPHFTPEQQSYYGAVQNYLTQSLIHRAGNISDPERGYMGKVFDLAVGGTTGSTAATMATLSYAASALSGYLWPAASASTPAILPQQAEQKAQVPSSDSKRASAMTFSQESYARQGGNGKFNVDKKDIQQSDVKQHRKPTRPSQ